MKWSSGQQATRNLPFSTIASIASQSSQLADQGDCCFCASILVALSGASVSELSGLDVLVHLAFGVSRL